MKTFNQWTKLVKTIEDDELRSIVINSEPFREAMHEALGNLTKDNTSMPKGPEWPYVRAWYDGYNAALKEVDSLL